MFPGLPTPSAVEPPPPGVFISSDGSPRSRSRPPAPYDDSRDERSSDGNLSSHEKELDLEDMKVRSSGHIIEIVCKILSLSLKGIIFVKPFNPCLYYVPCSGS